MHDEPASGVATIPDGNNRGAKETIGFGVENDSTPHLEGRLARKDCVHNLPIAQVRLTIVND